MATTVGQHSVAAFTSPVNGTTPIDANSVRGNDNTVRSAYVDHDADPGIHVQSSTLASRPAAGTAGRKWITEDSGVYTLWFDDGTNWHPVSSENVALTVLAGENLAKGDVVKVTGWNNGQDLPEVAKVASASDVAFAIMTAAVSSGAMGYATNTGIVQDVNTNSFAVGTILYPNTSGGFTSTKPTSGNYQTVAFVLRQNTNNGVIFVEFSSPRIVERSDNTASTIVLRDASGNFSAGTITAGALTSTGLVTFASLKGTGATTVTNILDEDNMASDSATALATQQSIKAYVDAQVATVDTLAEVLANGNTTGANDIIVNSGQKIRTPLVAAQDGTSAITIANSTGALTLNTALADSNLATISTASKVSNSATTATDANTASAIVARDASGNFTAGTITANLTGNVSGSSGSTTGNAATATALQTARNINGVSFNGTADITVTAAAGTLSGSTLASGVTASSLTSVGTLTSLTVSGAIAGATSTNTINGLVINSGGLGGATGIKFGIGAAFSSGQAEAYTTSTTPMGIGTVGAQPLRFYTNSALVAAFDSSGNLAVDTNTLYVDAANNRVGVGTASPASTLDVRAANASQAVRVTATTGTNPAYFGANNTGGAFYFGLDNSAGTEFGSAYTGAIYLSGAYPITFYTNATERMRLDASGNLGLGVTPSAWGSGYKAIQNLTSSLFGTTSRDMNLGANVFVNSGGNYAYIQSSFATNYTQYNGTHAWYTAPSGTAGNAITFTQAMTLDASGNLGIGATSPSGRLTLQRASAGADTDINWKNELGNDRARIRFGGSNEELSFWTPGGAGATERARITSGGYFKASDAGTYAGSTGNYHELRTSASTRSPTIQNTHATQPFGILIEYTAAAPNGAGNDFVYCSDNAAARAVIRSNGGLANYQANDVNLSDERVKTDIKPVGSYWDKLKAIEIVTFKYVDQTHDDDNIGVIAQQVEAVAPEFIDVDGFGETPEDGIPLKTVYTTDMYHAAIKALQEAMARIEALEARLEALEA